MRRKGTIPIVLGLLLIALAFGLVVYNHCESEAAGRASDNALEHLLQIIEENTGASQLPILVSPNNQAQMPTVEIDGYSYIGVLSIPSRDISLPVMATWDYNRLTKAPCRYSGSYYAGDLVICAHNYARHFYPILDMDIGTEVRFVTVEGVVLRYVVSNRETVQPTACDQMIDSNADWDLTLFTCNLSGQTRCAVRCLLVADQPMTE